MTHLALAFSILFGSITDIPKNVTPLIAERHSGRSYDSQKSISPQQLLSLVEAARWSASCYNDQPWNFIICDRNQNKEAYDKAFSCLAEGNQAWAQNAPVLIVIVASPNFKHNGERNRWGAYDTGAAATQMSLQAVSMNLMTHQMGGFDEAQAMKLFNIPKDYIPMAIMAIGYEKPPENAKASRERIPLQNNFFLGEWGKGF